MCFCGGGVQKLLCFTVLWGGDVPLDYMTCLKRVGTIYIVIVCSKICLCIAALVAAAVMVHPFRV